MNDTGKEFPSLSVAVELAKEKLYFQSEQWNAIDQKNAIVLAVYGIILAMMVSIDLKDHWACPRFVQALGMFIWLLLTVWGMAYSIVSIIPRTIDMPPKISHLSEKYLKNDEYDTKNVLLSTFEKSIKENDEIIEKKSKCLKNSIEFFLPASLSITVLFVLFKLFFGGN